MTRAVVFTLLALARASLAWAAPPVAVELGSQRELFVDHYLIDKLSGVELRMQKPVDRGPAFAFDKPWEGAFCGYVTILRDGDVLRAYYRGMPDTDLEKKSPPEQVACMAESTDGVHWTKPELDLYPRAGQAKTNIVVAGVGATTHNFAPFLDDRPGVAPDNRYKAVGGVDPLGLFAFASADGVHWRLLRDDPVFTKQQAQVREGDNAYGFDSQNVAHWSDAEQKYVLYYRIFRDDKRRIARAESDDFITWRKPTLMEYRRGDGSPAPLEHLYTNQTHPYFRAPRISVAIAARFMPGRVAITDEQARAIGVDPRYFHDVSDAVLMTTRGGSTYDRTFMEAFVAPGPGAENWTSRTNYPALGLVQTGPAEMSLYLNQNYGQPTAHLRRYTLRLDGFAAVHANYDGGEMITKPLTFVGSRLLLNFATSAAGGVKVEIQDPDGAPISGFTLADCRELIGNETDRAVVFAGGDLSSLASRPVRLRFVMKDADLFALRFAAD